MSLFHRNMKCLGLALVFQNPGEPPLLLGMNDLTLTSASYSDTTPMYQVGASDIAVGQESCELDLSFIGSKAVLQPAMSVTPRHSLPVGLYLPNTNFSVVTPFGKMGKRKVRRKKDG